MNFHTPRAWFHTIKHLFFDPIYLANALQIIIIFLLWMASNFRTKRSRKHAQLPVLDVPYFAQNFTSNLSYKTELGKLIYTIDSNCFLLAFDDSKWCHQTVVGLHAVIFCAVVLLSLTQTKFVNLACVNVFVFC